MSTSKSGGDGWINHSRDFWIPKARLPMPPPFPFNPPRFTNRKWLNVRNTEERKWRRGSWLVRFCCRVQVSHREKEKFPKMKVLSAVKTKLSLTILGFSGDIFPLSISQWLLISWFKWRLCLTQSNSFLKPPVLIGSIEKPKEHNFQ